MARPPSIDQRSVADNTLLPAKEPSAPGFTFRGITGRSRLESGACADEKVVIPPKLSAKEIKSIRAVLKLPTSRSLK